MNNKRSKIYAIFAALFLVCTVCVMTGCSKEEHTSETSQTEQLQQAVVLENYGLNVQVQSKHRLVVTEILTVNYADQISGITRVIPYEGYRFDPEKNEVVQYRMVLDQIDVDADYTVEKQAGKAYLSIGGSDSSNTGGTQIYTLKYRLSYYQDEDITKDLLYCDLLPYDWEGKITSANINITLPKDFETSGITMYRYAGGSWVSSDVAYTASGKTISAHLKQEDILANADLSILVKLPEGYFKGEKTLLPLQVFFYVLIIFMTLGILAFWWFFGKPGKAQKAELIKKHRLSVLEDAYLLRGTIAMTDIAALLTDWAERGMLRIIQLSAKEYSITCLEPPEQTAKNFEMTVYEALSKDGVMTHTTAAAAARLRKVLPKVKRQVAKSCANLCGGRLYTLESACVKLAALVFSVLPIVIVLAVGGHLVLDYSAGYVGLIAAAALLVVHTGILVLVYSWKNLRKLIRPILSAIVAIIEVLILGGVLYYAGSELMILPQTILAVVALLLMFGASVFSGRKSVGYQTQLAQLAAYKRYLRNPDLEGADVATLYYGKLSQAYVLRIGKLFSKKCDGYPLYAHDGMIFLGEEEKLSHAMGFYPSYQQFVLTLLRVQPESIKPLKSEAAPAEKTVEKEQKTEKKASGFAGVLALIGASVVAVFQKLAVWINEAIDWVELQFEKLKNKFSRKSETETEDDTESDGAEEKSE